MKRILLCLLLSVFHCGIHAQTAFAPVGATWNFQASTNYYYHARAVATTVTQGKACSIVNYYWHRKGYPVALSEAVTFCTSGDTVFYQRAGSALWPLYVFNVSAGDTIPFYKGPTFSDPDSFFHVRIDSVEPRFWGGKMLRTVWGKTVAPAPTNAAWRGYAFPPDTASRILYVERLGTLNGNGLLPWHSTIIFQEAGAISCYYDGTLDVRLLSSDSCNGVPEGVTAIRETSFSLYPNPAAGSCILQFRYPLPINAHLSVYDVCGRKTIDKVLPAGTGNQRLEIAQWPAGIYFIEVSSRAGKLWQKLVKD